MKMCTNSTCGQPPTRLVAIPAQGWRLPGKGSLNVYCQDHADWIVGSMGGIDVTEGTDVPLVAAALRGAA